MSAKAIREATGKELINKYLEGGSEIGVAKSRFASVNEATEWNQLLIDHPWLETTVSTQNSRAGFPQLNETLKGVQFSEIPSVIVRFLRAPRRE